MYKLALHLLTLVTILMVGLLFTFGKSIELIIFKYQQIEIHSEVEEMIEKKHFSEKIQTIVFSSEHFNKIKWTRTNKEFIYHNNRFDVVKIIHTNDFVIVKCVADNREDRLFEEFEKISKEKTTSDSENKNSSEDFSEDILIAILHKNSSFDISTLKELSYSGIPSYYLFSLEKDSPPPQLLG